MVNGFRPPPPPLLQSISSYFAQHLHPAGCQSPHLQADLVAWGYCVALGGDLQVLLYLLYSVSANPPLTSIHLHSERSRTYESLVYIDPAIFTPFCCGMGWRGGSQV